MQIKTDFANSDKCNILDQLDDLESIAHSAGRLAGKLKTAVERGFTEIEGDGLTQETCEDIMTKFKALHRKSEKLTARGWISHTHVRQHTPEGMNEGPKC